MRSIKLGVLMAVFALSAIGAANAQAASQFTASATGNLTGKALETQKFHTAGGTVECETIDVEGEIKATASPEQTALVTYTGCNAFGFPVDITPKIHYIFTANGGVHLESHVVLTVTAGLLECTITIYEGQWFTEAITYTNNSGKIKVTPNVTGIKYNSSGGACGSKGDHTDGTYTGASEIERAGGGTVSWDA